VTIKETGEPLLEIGVEGVMGRIFRSPNQVAASHGRHPVVLVVGEPNPDPVLSPGSLKDPIDLRYDAAVMGRVSVTVQAVQPSQIVFKVAACPPGIGVFDLQRTAKQVEGPLQVGVNHFERHPMAVQCPCKPCEPRRRLTGLGDGWVNKQYGHADFRIPV
jgi:hypothetical protein